MDAEENYNRMMRFMASSETASPERIDSDLTRESLFQSILKRKHSSRSADKKGDAIMAQLEGLSSL